MTEDPSAGEECPLCGGVFADGMAVENHILNKSDDKHTSAADYDLNRIDQVRDWYRRERGEDTPDRTRDGGPPADPRRAGRAGSGSGSIETGAVWCDRCGSDDWTPAPDVIPEHWICKECSADLPEGEVYAFSPEDLDGGLDE